MKCESCNMNEIEVEEIEDIGRNPYLLCRSCQQRLLYRALRPLEFFNLASIHGGTYYLHDDFYDYDTGKATDPQIDVVEAEKFPFPKLDEIKSDLQQLVNFACIQYFISEEVIELLKLHDKHKLLSHLDNKVKYNRAINFEVYKLAGKVLGSTAAEWIREEWSNRKEDELLIFAEAISKCLAFKEAYSILTIEVEASDDKHLVGNSFALFHLQSSKTLDWIEKISNRIVNVSEGWGTLAAVSQFSWKRALKWMKLGRPLSLIALDALNYCTTTNRQNQIFWFQRHPPKLTDNPKSQIIAQRLQQYLIKDNVPRTKNKIAKIINNVFEIAD